MRRGGRAGEAVECGDDEDGDGASGGESFSETWAGPVDAGESVVGVDGVGLDAECVEGVELHGEILPTGGDAGVADEQGPTVAVWGPFTAHCCGRVLRESVLAVSAVVQRHGGRG